MSTALPPLLPLLAAAEWLLELLLLLPHAAMATAAQATTAPLVAFGRKLIRLLLSNPGPVRPTR